MELCIQVFLHLGIIIQKIRMAQIQASDCANGLGRNKAFTLSIVDPLYNEKRDHNVNADPFFTWKEAFDFGEFVNG
jgi:hypothetical protein